MPIPTAAFEGVDVPARVRPGAEIEPPPARLEDLGLDGQIDLSVGGIGAEEGADQRRPEEHLAGADRRQALGVPPAPGEQRCVRPDVEEDGAILPRGEGREGARSRGGGVQRDDRADHGAPPWRSREAR